MLLGLGESFEGVVDRFAVSWHHILLYVLTTCVSVGEVLKFTIAAVHEIDVVGKSYVAYGPSINGDGLCSCLLYTSPSPRDRGISRMPSSA